MLFAADGKVLLSKPLGVAFFIVWILWWVIAFSMRSQKFLPCGRRARALHGTFYIGIILAICVGAPWEYTHFIQPLPRNGLLAWVGVTVSVFSVFLLTAAMWMAGNLYGIRRNDAGDTYLVSGGPYRYVRHPGYLSGVLFIMGIALSLSSLIAWFAFVLVTAYSIFRIRKDEEKLEQMFTEAFTNYRVRTRWMLLPGIF